MYKKIAAGILILISVLALILCVFPCRVANALKNPDTILEEVSIVDEEEWNEVIGQNEMTPMDENAVLYNGGSAAYDAGINTFYLSQDMGSASWDGIFAPLEPDAKLYILKDDLLYDKASALEEGYSFSCLYLEEEGTCSGFSIVFTGLPTVSLEYDAEYPLTTRKEDHDGVIAVQGTDGSYVLSECSFHLRGDTTLSYDKKSYKVTLKTTNGEKNHLSLLGMRCDDDWILNAQYTDGSRIREPLAYELWEEMQILTGEEEAKTSHMEFVEVFINDAYMGLYTLMEPIDGKTFGLEEDDILYKTNDWEQEEWSQGMDQYQGLDTISGAKIEWPNETSHLDWSVMEILYQVRAGNLTWDEMIEKGVEVDLDNLTLFNLFVFLSRANDTLWKNIYFECVMQDDGTYLVRLYPWDLNASFGDNYAGEYKEGSGTEVISEYGDEVSKARLWKDYRSYDPVDCNERIVSMWKTLRDSGLSAESVQEMAEELWTKLLASGAIFREADRWPGTVDGNDYTNLYPWLVDRFATLDGEYVYVAK